MTSMGSLLGRQAGREKQADRRAGRERQATIIPFGNATGRMIHPKYPSTVVVVLQLLAMNLHHR